MNDLTIWTSLYRHKGIACFLCTLFICAFPLHAQQVISPDKVKEAYQHATDTFSLDGYDKMLNYNEYLAGCPNLRNAGGIALPPSYWGLMIVDEDGQCSFENHTVFLEEGEIREKRIDLNIFRHIDRTYDHIVFTSYGYYTELAALLVRNLTGRPYYLEFDGCVLRDSKNTIKESLKRLILSRASGVFSSGTVTDSFLHPFLPT